jgi:membrane fusion protein (multidrug efflux system)
VDTPTPTGGNILVVDDDLGLCQVIVDTLSENGYNATFVQNTEEALEYLSKSQPDLVVLDLEVPRMGGFVFCQKLRASPQTKNVPVIFITVRDSEFDQKTAVSLGANQYITKPFRRSHLLAEVQKLMETRGVREDWIAPSPGFQKKAPGTRAETPAPQAPRPVVLPPQEFSPPPSSIPSPAPYVPIFPPEELLKTETPQAPAPVISTELAAPPSLPAAAPEPEASVPIPPAPAQKDERASPPAVPPKPVAAPQRTGKPIKLAPKPVAADDKPAPQLLTKEKASRIKAWALTHKPVAVGLAATVTIVLMWGSVAAYRHFSSAAKAKGGDKKEEASEMAVNVLQIAFAPFQDVMSAVGTIVGGSEIELRFQVEGKLVSLKPREGDTVKRGQVVGELDQTQTKIKLERAESEYFRYEKLYALGGVSKDRLDEARVQYKYAQSELDKTVLIATKDGIFGDRGVEVGEFITPQKKVGTLVSLDTVLVRVGVIEKEIDKIYPGQEVLVTVDTYPDQEFKGKVENISPLVQGQSKTLSVEARIPNDGKLLLPGMFARTRVVVYQKDSVISVPNDALEKNQNAYQVFLVGEGNKAEARPVQVGYVSMSHSVISEGLRPGDKVIMHKPQGLKAGVPLKIIDVEKAGQDGTVPGAPPEGALDETAVGQ